MDFANVCPTEDAIALLLELLFDPKLPATPIARSAPSKEDQESVGKQVHAVVLLYNYHYRKLHPQLEFLSFENFCKLAVTSRPTLAAYLGLMQRSHETETLQLSLTKEKIMSACQISMGLDASKKVPSMDGWPVSKIAVFFVDSKKENCLVQFGSITQGVWSVIEKDVDVRIGSSESPSDEPALQQLAFLAVKEAIDINQNDLLVLESHLSYSTSKEKAAARFYIMQCTQANSDDAMQYPIKDVINSLQGPFLIKESVGWMYTAPVEHFHLLPYAEMLSDWFSSLPASGSHHAHTTYLSQIPQPSFQDPLQYELERIRKEYDKITTTHEVMKLQIRLDCEKEIEEAIAQIRRKYEIKVEGVGGWIFR